MANDLDRFKDLRFDDFRRMALDPSLSPIEKIGFPNSYREGKEDLIWEDVLAKLPALRRERQFILDIGPGCGKLGALLVNACERQKHTLILIDSPEMLSHTPDKPFMIKIPARYP